MFPIVIAQADGAVSLPDDAPITYIVGRRGLYVRKETPVFTAFVPIREAPMLQSLIPNARYHIDPAPATLTVQLIAFFRAVAERQGTEATAFLAYHERRKRFHVVVPPQLAGQTWCAYATPEQAPKGSQFIGTVHSHAALHAFHSGEDRADETSFDGVHVTIGRVGAPAVEVAASLVISSHRFALNPEHVLGGLQRVGNGTRSRSRRYTIVGGNGQPVAFPTRWLRMVRSDPAIEAIAERCDANPALVGAVLLELERRAGVRGRRGGARLTQPGAMR